MAKGRMRPEKVRNKKILREARRIAVKFGFKFDGIDGGGHYKFTKGDKILRLPSTPRDIDESLTRFRARMQGAQ